MNKGIVIPLVAAVLIIARANFAQEAIQAATPATSSLDRSFVEALKLYAAHQTEIGRLAEQRASTEELRAFGETLANQASRLGADLTDIAVTAGMALQKESTAGHSRTWYELQQLSGAAFDQRFLMEVRRDQRDALRIVQEERERGSNAQLRQFAINLLSLLEQNRAAANQLGAPTQEEQQELRAEERARQRREEPLRREPTPSNPAGGSTTSHWQY